MKVSCPSCDTKYAIADDKVVGKKIKVRCKTCNTQILVDGNAPQGSEPTTGVDAVSASDSNTQPESSPTASASMESNESDVWTVNLSESEERSMTTKEIVDAALKNELGSEVFVWKDGMGDWALYSDVPELRAAIDAANATAPHSPTVAAANAASKTPAGTQVAPLSSTTKADGESKATDTTPEKRGPIVAAPGSALAKKMASAKAASLAPKAEAAPTKATIEKESKPIPGQKAATRLASKRPNSTHDLFAAVDRAGSEIDVDTSDVQEADRAKATGARNENSVLFSLDALKSGVLGSTSPSKTSQPGPAAPSGRKAPAAPTKRLEDLMTIDSAAPLGPMGGGLLLSGNDALLTAPAPPPPKPEPKPVPVAAVAAAVGVGAPAPKPKNKIAVMAGIIAAVGVVGAAGAFIALKLAAPDTAAVPSASATTTTSPSSAPSVPALPSSPPAASTSVAVASSAPEQPAPSTTPSTTKVATGPVSGKPPTGKVDPKEPKKPDTKPEPAAPAAAGGFSKEAAVAALSVAASQATVCKKPEGPWGTGKCQVTFAPSGRVTSANVMGAPFAGTPVGGCVSSVFRRARIPGFNGDAVTVSKSFTISP